MESGRVRARVSESADVAMGESVPLAVLIGPQTASSGEAVAVAFRGRPHTVIFGQRSRGLSTSNNQFRLSDGAILNLSVSVFADRQGRRYGDELDPDVAVPSADAQAVAAGWIRHRGEPHRAPGIAAC